MGIIIIGGRGNGTVIASAIKDITGCYVLGFLNDAMQKGEDLDGYPILGKTSEALHFDFPTTQFIYALLTAKKSSQRALLLSTFGIPEDKFPTLCHPSAVIGEGVKLGFDVVLMPSVTISPGAIIGNHTHIYAGASIGHDTHLGNYCMVTSQVCLGSSIVAGDGAYFGMNCTIREHIKIGEWSIIGMGSVVLKDVEPYTIVVGNPAKKIGEVER